MIRIVIDPAEKAAVAADGRANATAASSWFLLDALVAHAAARPAEIALTFLDSRGRVVSEISHAGLFRAASAVARMLRDRFLPGDRVILCLPTEPEYVASFLGCLLAGIIAVPLYPPANSKHLPRLRSVAVDSGARAVLVSEGEHRRLLAILDVGGDLLIDVIVTEPFDVLAAGRDGDPPAPIATSPEAIAFLQYTSGSTGDPKGVMISHANLAANARLVHPRFLGDQRGTGVSWLPLYHDMGLIGSLIQSIVWGDPLVLLAPTSFAQRPLTWLEAVSRYKAVRTGAPNFALEMCCSALTKRPDVELDLSSLRILFCGAEPIRPATLRRFVDTFAPYGLDRAALMPCYGLAEATLFVTGAAWHGRLADTLIDASGDAIGCGPVADDTRVAIVCPESHARKAPGEIGEVWVAGPQIAEGYWQRPELTNQVFRACIHGEEPGRSYLRTGDLGLIHDGELWIRGRTKEMIILNGRNHYPADLENTAASHCDAIHANQVTAVAIEGQAGPSLALVAEVVRTSSLKDLDAGVKDIRRAITSAHGITPQVIMFLSRGALPKTSSGKLRRTEVAQRFNQLSAQAQHVWRASEITG